MIDVLGYFFAGVINVSVAQKPISKPFKHSLLGGLPDFIAPTIVIFKGFTADEITVLFFHLVHFVFRNG